MAEQKTRGPSYGTIAAIVVFIAAVVFVAGSVIFSRNVDRTADAIGSSSGLEHQPRPNNIQNQPKRPDVTTGGRGIAGDQTTNVPPAGNDHK